MEAETSYRGSSKHLMHRSSFPTKSHMSEHSTRTENNDFLKIDSLLAKRRCYSVTSNMPTLFIEWGNHMSTLLLTRHLFPLELSLNLKFCPFLQDFWASRKQAQLQSAVSSFIPTCDSRMYTAAFPTYQLHKYRTSKTSV